MKTRTRPNVQVAEQQLSVACTQLEDKIGKLQAHLNHKPELIIVTGGFMAGVLTMLLPIRVFARLGEVIATTLIATLRSSAGPLLIAALLKPSSKEKRCSND